ncbi:ATPase [Rhodococcoides trifolii]|uniref:ATPase n=1 Tax=Rhodococcoides trifolii TaxID=908250 RepID=A0A917CWC9_9NOCA|nr:ATPase [Rhodococcus trifolii]
MWQGTTAQLAGLYPFAAAAGAQVRGVPLGRHLHTAEPIGLDPAQWLKDGLVTNTGIWVQMQPGVGKSTLLKRLGMGLVGFGFMMVVPGDLKNEYTPLVNAMGGQVFEVGRGLHCVNPLDLGPMRDAITAATGSTKDQLLETARTRRLDLLEGLLVIGGSKRLDPTWRLYLARAVDLVDDARETYGLDHTIPDILNVMTQGPQALRDVIVADNDFDYRRETRDFRNTLRLMVEGPIRGLFDRPSSFEISRDSPALSLGLKAIERDSSDVVAAAMLCAQAWCSAVIDSQQAVGTRRNIYVPRDEMWRALRSGSGLVDLMDRGTRMDRNDGVVTAYSTHSMTDLDALPTEQDRAKAKGLAARNGIKVYGGMDHAELSRVNEISPLTNRERSLLASWQAPPTWVPGQAHPGRGKYIIKSGARLGLPVAVTLTRSEQVLYDTDQAFADIERSDVIAHLRRGRVA